MTHREGDEMSSTGTDVEARTLRVPGATLYYEVRGEGPVLLGGYVPDFGALENVSTRIVSAAGETSGEQAARRSAIALAERLGTPVAYLPGSHGGWGSDPQEFAERLHGLLLGP
jgi:hypothetical protein